MTTLALVAVGAIISAWFYRIERNLVGINEDLTTINDNLIEASEELLARLAELEAAVATGEVVDPALLAAVRQRAESLANIVPDAFEVPAEEAAPGAEAEA
jgi:hypothetical protein